MLIYQENKHLNPGQEGQVLASVYRLIIFTLMLEKCVFL